MVIAEILFKKIKADESLLFLIQFDFVYVQVLSTPSMSVETGGAIPVRVEVLLKSPIEERPSRMERLLQAKSRALAHLRHEGCIVVPFQGDEPLSGPQSWSCVCGYYAIPINQTCKCGTKNPKR